MSSRLRTGSSPLTVCLPTEASLQTGIVRSFDFAGRVSLGQPLQSSDYSPYLTVAKNCRKVGCRRARASHMLERTIKVAALQTHAWPSNLRQRRKRANQNAQLWRRQAPKEAQPPPVRVSKGLECHLSSLRTQRLQSDPRLASS